MEDNFRLHYENNNKTVLDILDENSLISNQLIEYWRKNFDVNFSKLREKYSKNK